MKKIYKFPVEIATQQEIKISGLVKVLSVAVQYNSPVLYAIIDDEIKREMVVELNCTGTGHEAEHIEGLDYLGTLLLNEDTFVYHCFYKIK